MFDESLLTRVLSRPAHDAPARALDEVVHLAQSAEYAAAAERAAELLEAGCKDVRPFIAYALGVFAERGPGSVPALFDPLTVLVSSRTADSGPSSPASRATDTALRFCFRIMKAHLDFDERRTSEARKSWVESFESSSAPAVLRACEDLRQAIHEAIDNPRSDAELGGVIARLEAYCNRSERRIPAKPEAKEAEREEDVLVLSEETKEPEAQAAVGPRLSPVPDDPADGPTLVVSPALQQFIRKLVAFEQLMTSDRLGKAAIVAHDIRQIVANFDPMIYLPNLLSAHFRLLSDNVDRLVPYWEQTGAPSWEAMDQLYRVDLEAFLEA